jgi:malate dehydrogenase (oxaloacetate-decarboxylating)(NADP+)
LLQRRGITPDAAKALVRTNNTVIAALAVKLGDADAMLAGPTGRYHRHLEQIRQVIGRRPGVREFSALSLLILPKGQVFIADTFVTPNPTAEGIVEMTLLAAEQVRRFGVEPKVALLSHSSFGSSDDESARKMRIAVSLLHAEAPDLEVEGEMHGDEALNEEVRQRVFPASRLRGAANLLILPNLDAANIAFTLLRSMGEGLSVGPVLVGGAASAHIVTPSVTARGLVNMTAVAAAQATALAERSRG